MGVFSKAKDIYTLQKQAKAIKKELKNIHIEADVDGVMITVTAEQDFIKVNISDGLWQEVCSNEYGKKKLEEILLKSMNKGTKKAQEIGSGKMKGIWEQMGGGALGK